MEQLSNRTVTSQTLSISSTHSYLSADSATVLHNANQLFSFCVRTQGLPGGPVVKNLPANAGDCKRRGFDPWFVKIPWRRKWQPTPVFFPGESHGHRSLAGCSAWVQERNMTACMHHLCLVLRLHTGFQLLFWELLIFKAARERRVRLGQVIATRHLPKFICFFFFGCATWHVGS